MPASRGQRDSVLWSELLDHVSDVSLGESQQPAVAKRRDKLSVTIEQRFGIDGRDVSDVSVSVEPNGVPLRCLLRRRRLSSVGADR